MREPTSSSGRNTTTDLLPRDRPTGALTRSSMPLALLAAPPGLGRTTLLQQWRGVTSGRSPGCRSRRPMTTPSSFWTRIVVDQAQLRGVLGWLGDLGVETVSMNPLRCRAGNR